MNFFADEGLDVPLVTALRTSGHNVIHALETMRGADDEAILKEAVANNAILLTKDKDFGEMIVRWETGCRGIVLIRIDELNNPHNIKQVVDFLSFYNDQLPDHFTVIQEDKIRIRKL